MPSFLSPLFAAAAIGASEAPPGPVVPPDEPIVFPSPDALRYVRLWAGPFAAWRSQSLAGPLAPGRPVDLSSPYAGIELGAEWLPWRDANGRGLGFLLDYAYGPLTLRAEGFSPSNASEHRVRAEFIGRSGDGMLGRFGLHLGVSYEGLLTSDGAPLVESTHFAPRLGVDWSREVVGPVRLRAELGVMPISYVGSALRDAYGSDVSSSGLDASIGLDGPAGLKGLRWRVGYDYLRNEDAFAAPGGATRQIEGVHRAGIGLSYER